MEATSVIPVAEDVRESVTVGDLLLHPSTGSVWWQGAPLDLHPAEFRLLLALVSRAGDAVSADALAQAVWGAVTKAGAAYVALYVRYLQQKLETDPSRPRLLRAVRGGYRLSTLAAVVSPPSRWSAVRSG